MARYILRRVVIAIFTLLVLVTIIFFLTRALPGDPLQSEKGNAQLQEQMRSYYGFDQPLYKQWFVYIGNLLKGDLGVSLKYPGRTVNDAIAQTFPISFALGWRALGLALAVGLILGTIAAQKAGKAIDYICILIAIIGVSAPDFIVGAIFQLIFAIRLQWFPAGLWEGAEYMVLPVVALSLYTLALVTRMMRSSMMEVLSQDYILTARAKGLSRFEIIWRHQLRNAILPVITIMGPLTASVLTGTFVIERIYAIPGMGKYYVTSVQDLDYAMVLGVTAFYGLFLVTANLIVDILYGIVDPRIKLAGGGRRKSRAAEE